MGFRAYAVTHAGTSRKSNEDSHLIDSELSFCVVADGSTHPKGAWLSQLACQKVQEALRQNRALIEAHHSAGRPQDRLAVVELLRQTIESVSAFLYNETQSKPELKGVISTICLALISRDYVFIGHLGDSRAYSVRDGVFQPLTRDHTYLAALIQEGKTLEEASRVTYAENLSAALGFQPHARASVQVRELAAGERIVLCTDGLSDLFGHSGFRATEWNALDGIALCEAMKDYALKKGARDNLTAIVIETAAPKRPRETTDLMNKLNTVRGIKLFEHFGERSLMKLLSLSDYRDLKPGEALVQRGEILNEMFIVLTGEFSVDLGAGNILPVLLKKGEVVGEMSLFEGSLPSATVTASTVSGVLSFHRDQLFQAMREDIEFAARLELGVLQAVIRRLRARTEPDEELKALKNYTVVSILPPEQF